MAWLRRFNQRWGGSSADSPQSSLAMDRLRTIVCILLLALYAAATGSSFGAQILLVPRRHLRVNPLVYAAIHPAPVDHTDLRGAASAKQKLRARMGEQRSAGSSLETQVAINFLNIEQIVKQNEVSIDDRQQLHNLIQPVASTEVNHYNVLNDRMNVDDARVMTIGWILGVLFTISQAVVVFFHLDRRRVAHAAGPPPAALPAPRKRRRPSQPS